MDYESIFQKYRYSKKVFFPGALPLCVRGRLKWWGVRVRYHTGRGQPGILNKYLCHLYGRSVINDVT